MNNNHSVKSCSHKRCQNPAAATDRCDANTFAAELQRSSPRFVSAIADAHGRHARMCESTQEISDTAQTPAGLATAHPNAMRILVAVADPSQRLAIETASRDLGHDCRSVPDAAQAYAAFQSDSPDVVISEWMFPRLAGRQLHDLIRADPRDQYTYFVIVPADESSSELVETVTAGADDYLSQPISRNDLQVCLIRAARVTSLHRQLAAKQLPKPLMSASPDGLTRLRNQRTLDNALELLDARVTRYQHRYCLALVHVDHFAAYRATHRPHESDTALHAIASTLRLRARSGDTVYRYGVAEFLHVLPEQTLATAHVAARRLIASVQELAIPDPRNRLGVITISVGLAILDPDRTDMLHDVRQHAEHALADAVRLGRNRVVAPTTTFHDPADIPRQAAEPAGATAAAARGGLGTRIH
jgi:diguanylate cyclase (GGDEF)-like protein